MTRRPVIAVITLNAAVFTAIWAFCVIRIDPGGTSEALPSGTGLTSDEPFYLTQGDYLLSATSQAGVSVWIPGSHDAADTFGSPLYMPDHPPAGKLLIAGAARCFSGFFTSGDNRIPLSITAARLASCFAAAVTAVICFEWMRRNSGILPATATVLIMTAIPAFIGFGRLASLEALTTCGWTANCLWWLSLWKKKTAPNRASILIAGLLWGMFLLIKIQAVLLPPMIILLSVFRWRRRSVLPLALFGTTGLVVFHAGWPWLWLAPVSNTVAYFASTTDRLPLYVWYLGGRFVDKAVPWHFPFATLLLTVPLSVIPPAVIGAFRLHPDRFVRIAAITLVVWPLVVFAVPGTPVYDSNRLFSMILPMLAMLGGSGLAEVIRRTQGSAEAAGSEPGAAARNERSLKPKYTRAAPAAAAALLMLLLIPGWHASAGCVPLAWNSLRFGSADSPLTEADYWPEVLNEDFWVHVPEDSTVAVAPVSHQFQLNDLTSLVPIIAERRIRLEPFQYRTEPRGLLLLTHRLADLRRSLRTVPAGAVTVHEAERHGVVLARLIDTTNAEWTEVPDWPEHER